MIALFMFLSGLFGRMGGAGKQGSWYDRILDTKWRDLGCPAVLIATVVWYFGWVPSLWWAYLAVFVLTFGALTTYWDEVFGYDNMWFSGLVVGLAGIPILFVYPSLFWFVVGRIVLLPIWWWMLNKYLPQRKIWVWDRAVVEEFCRYAVTL